MARAAYQDVTVTVMVNGNGNGNGGLSMPYGMPDGGYVVSPNAGNNNGNGNQAAQMPPPNMPSYQDLVEGVQNINPGLGRNQIQPPPTQGGLNRPGDTPLTRDNMGNFLGDSPTQSFGRNRPEPGFSFSADEARDNGPAAGPMSMEEAQRLGLLGGNANVPADNNGFFPNEINQPSDDEEGLNIPYDDGDGVAAFRNRNNSGVRNRGNGNLNNAGRRNNRRSSGGIAVPAALAGLGSRVRRIINPVQPVAANTPRA